MTTWAKRNPLLTAAMFLGAWFLVRVVLPSGLKATFQGVLGMIVGKALSVLASLPVPGAAAAADFIGTRLVGFVWTACQWIAALALGALFPPLGIFIVAWQITSTVSNGNSKTEKTITNQSND